MRVSPSAASRASRRPSRAISRSCTFIRSRSAAAAAATPCPAKPDHIDNTKRLKLILNECSVGVDYAGIVVLLKTLPGLADAAGAAIDAMKLPDMLGCISGNDAVAIVARGEQEAERLCYDLRQYCK